MAIALVTAVVISAVAFALRPAGNDDAWTRATVSTHYAVVDETGAIDKPNALAERIHADLSAFFSTAPSDKPLRVRICRDQKAFLSALPGDAQPNIIVRSRRGQYSRHDATCYLWPAGDERDTRETLAHECVHQFRDRVVPSRDHLHDLYEEGLAQHFAAMAVEGHPVEIGFLASDPRHVGVAEQALRRFEEVHGRSLRRLATNVRGFVNDAEAWALVSFLVRWRPDDFRRFLSLTDAGVAPAEAWDQVFDPAKDAEMSRRFEAVLSGDDSHHP